jgi:hypothetical protein
MFTSSSMRKWLALAAMTWFLMAPAPSQAAKKDGPRIRLLDVHDFGETLEVSFRVENAFDERIDEKLESGLEISFRHQVGVRRRRTWWVERGVVEKKIFTTAIRDTLTGVYSLKRVVNEGIVETSTTSDLDEARTFLTEVRDISMDLPDWLPRDQRTEIRVRSDLETRFWLFFPYSYDTNWVSQPLLGPVEEREVKEATPPEQPASPEGAAASGGGGAG